MKKRLLLPTAMLIALLLPLVSEAQVPLVNAKGASLEDLVGTQTLVTIRLKGSGARQSNLIVRGVEDNHILFTDANAIPISYLKADLFEIRIQESRVSIKARSRSGFRKLSANAQGIQDRATERAIEIFNDNRGNQLLALKAASLLGAQGDQAAVEQYIRPRAETNDLETSVLASVYLYLAGHEPDSSVIDKGLSSSNRLTIASAANLAGLLEYKAVSGKVRALLDDTISEIFFHGAVASARLGNRETIPTLIKALRSKDLAKAEAAVFALSLLGGDSIKRELTTRLERATGAERFRIIRVLYEMGDEEMADMLRPDILREPLYAMDAAMILSAKGDWDASMELRDALKEGKPSSVFDFINRARMAMAIHLSGNLSAKAELQSLLQLSPDDIYLSGLNESEEAKKLTVEVTQGAVCALIAVSASRDLMSLLKAPLESQNPGVALAACEAAVCIANPEYHERFTRVFLEDRSDG